MVIRIISSTKQQPSDDGRVNLCLTGAAHVNARKKWVALDQNSIDSVTPLLPLLNTCLCLYLIMIKRDVSVHGLRPTEIASAR